VAVCFRAAAKNLMQIRAKENVFLYGAVRSMDIHLTDYTSSTIEQLGYSNLNDSTLTVAHKDIMIDTLRKAMIRFQEEEAYANTTKRNLILIDLIRYK
jgi:hypothetical protein